MKALLKLFGLFLFTTVQLYAQKVEKITVPDGVVYNYCKPSTLEKAHNLIREDLANADSYAIVDNIMFIGPVLWDRYKKVDDIKNIAGGHTTLLVDNKQLSAKLTQQVDDSRRVWAELRRELTGKEYVLRKATPDELRYYWAVISFDIEEPLVILETADRSYLLNLSPKSLMLLWLDEIPKK